VCCALVSAALAEQQREVALAAADLATATTAWRTTLDGAVRGRRAFLAARLLRGLADPRHRRLGPGPLLEHGDLRRVIECRRSGRLRFGARQRRIFLPLALRFPRHGGALETVNLVEEMGVLTLGHTALHQDAK